MRNALQRDREGKALGGQQQRLEWCSHKPRTPSTASSCEKLRAEHRSQCPWGAHLPTPSFRTSVCRTFGQTVAVAHGHLLQKSWASPTIPQHGRILKWLFREVKSPVKSIGLELGEAEIAIQVSWPGVQSHRTWLCLSKNTRVQERWRSWARQPYGGVDIMQVPLLTQNTTSYFAPSLPHLSSGLFLWVYL